jgi:hypothetical protein
LLTFGEAHPEIQRKVCIISLGWSGLVRERVFGREWTRRGLFLRGYDYRRDAYCHFLAVIK